MIYLGIDPGQNGGIAGVWEEKGESFNSECAKMPPTDQDVYEYLAFFQKSYAGGVKFAVLERAHARPGDGVSGMFKFGMGYGALRMALAALEIRYEEISPQKWQKGMGIITRDRAKESHTQFKNRLKAKAQQLFPEKKVTLSTCDALLIAEFCRRNYS